MNRRNLSTPTNDDKNLFGIKLIMLNKLYYYNNRLNFRLSKRLLGSKNYFRIIKKQIKCYLTITQSLIKLEIC